ncbi:hypothetical protein AOC36_09480 [Erysipelothrix larvae]|uniref:Uncharacterized protein n=1 Tax=Erysipelothrix larvae TaxID=1514105 RepID=A0A0X8H1E8_9FIRM|nr:hypothetical protein [Erysipelothrix larvae]AMC94204.1 hypothetical protein AOC36_09480 [Erysipelothrix larvae]
MEHITPWIDKVIWAITIYLGRTVQKLHKKDKAQGHAILSILRKDIIGIWEKARDRGYTTDYEYETMHSLICNYYDMGGNGLIHKVEKMYDQLEMRTDPLDRKYENKATS